MYHRNSKKKKLVTAIFLLLVLLFLIIENIILKNSIRSGAQRILAKRFAKLSSQDDVKEDVVVKFDLNKPAQPTELYDGISCKLSSKFANVETILCIYQNDENDFDSKSILKSGISNGQLISIFI
jgi:hypothetical protein